MVDLIMPAFSPLETIEQKKQKKGERYFRDISVGSCIIIIGVMIIQLVLRRMSTLSREFFFPDTWRPYIYIDALLSLHSLAGRSYSA